MWEKIWKIINKLLNLRINSLISLTIVNQINNSDYYKKANIFKKNLDKIRKEIVKLNNNFINKVMDYHRH